METKLALIQTLFVTSFMMLVSLGFPFEGVAVYLALLNGVATFIWLLLVLSSFYYYNLISTGYESLPSSRSPNGLEKFLFAAYNVAYLALIYLFYIKHWTYSVYATIASVCFMWIIVLLEYKASKYGN